MRVASAPGNGQSASGHTLGWARGAEGEHTREVRTCEIPCQAGFPLKSDALFFFFVYLPIGCLPLSLATCSSGRNSVAWNVADRTRSAAGEIHNSGWAPVLTAATESSFVAGGDRVIASRSLAHVRSNFALSPRTRCDPESIPTRSGGS